MVSHLELLEFGFRPCDHLVDSFIVWYLAFFLLLEKVKEERCEKSKRIGLRYDCLSRWPFYQLSFSLEELYKHERLYLHKIATCQNFVRVGNYPWLLIFDTTLLKKLPRLAIIHDKLWLNMTTQRLLIYNFFGLAII